MKRFLINFCLATGAVGGFLSWGVTPKAFGPTPSENQQKWQDMETYAFIHYSVYATTDWNNWTKVASGEFSNIVNNPIWQTVKFDPVKASVLRIEADRISEGEHMAYSDVEILYE